MKIKHESNFSMICLLFLYAPAFVSLTSEIPDIGGSDDELDRTLEDILKPLEEYNANIEIKTYQIPSQSLVEDSSTNNVGNERYLVVRVRRGHVTKPNTLRNTNKHFYDSNLLPLHHKSRDINHFTYDIPEKKELPYNRRKHFDIVNNRLIRKFENNNNLHPLTYTDVNLETSKGYAKDGDRKTYHRTSKSLVRSKPRNNREKGRFQLLRKKPEHFTKQNKLENKNNYFYNSNLSPFYRRSQHFRHLTNDVSKKRRFNLYPYNNNRYNRNQRRLAGHERNRFLPNFQSNFMAFEEKFTNKRVSKNKTIIRDVNGVDVHYVITEDLSSSKDEITPLNYFRQMSLLGTKPNIMWQYRSHASYRNKNNHLALDGLSNSESTNESNGTSGQKINLTSKTTPNDKITSQYLNFQTTPISPFKKRLRKRFGHVKKQLSYRDYPKSLLDEEVTEILNDEPLDRWKYIEDGTSEVMPNQVQQGQFEDNRTQDISSVQKPKELRNNRLYFKNVPLNSYLSWYLYLNCSREQCQFTNTSDETELLNEGWKLHNCTAYGCTELYTKTESIKRYIGLIILVLSLCVLKIMVFLLVFYYCRRVKLPRTRTDDPKNILWDDEERNDALKENTFKMENDTKQKMSRAPDKFAGDVGSNFNESENKTSPLNNTGFHAPPEPVPADKLDSKIWVPPSQVTSPCLIPSKISGDLVVPTKCPMKKKPFALNSKKLLKSKRKDRSNIPRLVRTPKCKDGRKYGQLEKEDIKAQGDFNFPTEKKKEDEDLLLMNLDDDDVLNESVYSTGNIEKSPNWETLIQHENKSFIHLDIWPPAHPKK